VIFRPQRNIRPVIAPSCEGDFHEHAVHCARPETKTAVDFTSTGPGTPGGKLLRSSWQPIFIRGHSSRDCCPLHVMRERFTLYRGENGHRAPRRFPLRASSHATLRRLGARPMRYSACITAGPTTVTGRASPRRANVRPDRARRGDPLVSGARTSRFDFRSTSAKATPGVAVQRLLAPRSHRERAIRDAVQLVAIV